MASEYLPAQVTEHLVAPRRIPGTYKIKVFVPIRRTDVEERFPVIYVTDADFFMGAVADICNQLQLEEAMARAIVVGVGYSDAHAAHLLRWRDFFTHQDRTLFQPILEELASAPLLRGSCQLSDVTRSTDATDFLTFLHTEVVPFIDARYPTVQGHNSYAGYSAGASFGLYTLAARPRTFGQYLLGSPVVRFAGNAFGLALVESFLESPNRPPVKIFLCVGEREEFGGSFRFTTGYYELATALRDAAPDGIHLTLELFPGESHSSAWVVAFTHGFKALFGRISGTADWWVASHMCRSMLNSP